MIIGIIAIIIVIIRNKCNSNKSTSNNNIVVLIEIRIEIFQGASLRMGSLHHIQVTGNDIEGTDYINNIDKYYI